MKYARNLRDLQRGRPLPNDIDEYVKENFSESDVELSKLSLEDINLLRGFFRNQIKRALDRSSMHDNTGSDK
jgi:hypothetical protein